MVQSKWKTVEETQEANEETANTAAATVDMIDDHGLAILGHRIRKPIFLDDDEE